MLSSRATFLKDCCDGANHRVSQSSPAPGHGKASMREGLSEDEAIPLWWVCCMPNWPGLQWHHYEREHIKGTEQTRSFIISAMR